MALNRQVIFNTAAQHLITQNARASNGYECMYRYNKDGVILKCAIGALIPDDKYKPYMENCRAHALMLSVFDEPACDMFNNYIGSDGEFLDNIQAIHDNCEPHTWKQELTAFAERNNLDLPSCLQ